MSTNCIRCVVNRRTGIDLLCDDCRAAANDSPESSGSARLMDGLSQGEQRALYYCIAAFKDVARLRTIADEVTQLCIDIEALPEGVHLQVVAAEAKELRLKIDKYAQVPNDEDQSRGDRTE